MTRPPGSAPAARRSNRRPRGPARSAGALFVAIVLLCAAGLVTSAQARITGYAGRFIAFERAGDIWVTSDDGQAQVNLTKSGEIEGHPSWGLRLDPCVTDNGRPLEPETRTLVYERDTGGGARDIFRATVDGSASPALSLPTNITQSPGLDEREPAAGVVTASGTPVVAFMRAGQGIWAMPLDGSAPPTQLTTGGTDAHPDWAPDGGSIAFDTVMGGTRQIAIVAVSYAGGVFTALGSRFVTAGPLSHTHPSRFDYAGEDPNNPGTVVTRRSRLLYATTYPDLGLDYLDLLQHSPDAVPPDQLFAPGSNPPPTLFELTGDPGGDSNPNVRPEGGGAVFQSTRDAPGNLDVYRVGSDGSGVTRLTTDPAADVDPDWEAITEPGGGQCLEPLPESPDPGPGGKPRNGRPAGSGGGGASSGSGTTPGGTNPGGTTSQSRLSVRRVRVTVSRAGGRRIIAVRLVVDRRASAKARLTRGRRVFARRGYRLHNGTNRLRLVVPRKVKAGRYRLTIEVRSAPWSRTIARTVRLGR